ncbi:MAG TPA: 2,3-bisphosphoglycerate-independent phosphoglycerate mutase [Actinomycetota bacterium]
MQELVTTLAIAGATRIVLVVMDGLGGVRIGERGSELAEADTPNLDRLALEGSSGVHAPVGPGVTPGSGAGHLALFGYDPLVYELGRGALSAAGIGFPLQPGDVAARVNFCTVDSDGLILDRRAGRIPTEENARLCRRVLDAVKLPPGIELHLQTERDHRALLVLRGEDLSPALADTDPQLVGLPPREPTALVPEAAHTAVVLAGILGQVKTILQGERANFVLLRGFDALRPFPSFQERYRLDAYAIAAYPMYMGIARILGMTVAPSQSSFAESVDTLKGAWAEHDFFYVHHKAPDAAGEDGDFERKCRAIEEVDALIPAITELGPDVVCVTGDHATPAPLRSHSWHPVPFVMWGAAVGADRVEHFDELSARAGAFSEKLGKDLMPLMLAAAGRLARYGP